MESLNQLMTALNTAPQTTCLPNAPRLTKQTNRYKEALAGTPPADKRRKRFEDKISWTVTDCWDLHAQIKRRIFLGQKNVEIAEALDCDKQTVTLVRNSPMIQEQLAELHERADEELLDVQREIAQKAPRALEVLTEIMNNGTKEHVRVTCARDLLDRAGYGAVQEIKIKDGLEELPREYLRAVINRLKGSGQVVTSPTNNNPNLVTNNLNLVTNNLNLVTNNPHKARHTYGE